MAGRDYTSVRPPLEPVPDNSAAESSEDTFEEFIEKYYSSVDLNQPTETELKDFEDYAKYFKK